MTRVFAQKLLKLLQHRNPSIADAYLDALEIHARAAIDRVFEAMLVLLFRHRIEVAPVRKLLESQDAAPDRFVLTYTNEDYEVVDRARLLQMAGIVE